MPLVTENNILKKTAESLGSDFQMMVWLSPIGDGKYLVMSMYSYTVNPPFFPEDNVNS
jgi:hydrogenase expression/formation protein HypE